MLILYHSVNYCKVLSSFVNTRGVGGRGRACITFWLHAIHNTCYDAGWARVMQQQLEPFLWPTAGCIMYYSDLKDTPEIRTPRH